MRMDDAPTPPMEKSPRRETTAPEEREAEAVAVAEEEEEEAAGAADEEGVAPLVPEKAATAIEDARETRVRRR